LETLHESAPGSAPDYQTIFKINQIVQELINCGNTDLSLKLFNAVHWKFTFHALEFSEQNFNRATLQKKVPYLEFLEKQTKMNVVDSDKMIDGFDMLVSLRFRAQFYMDFINAPSGLGHIEFGSENMFGHFQMVRAPIRS